MAESLTPPASPEAQPYFQSEIWQEYQERLRRHLAEMRADRERNAALSPPDEDMLSKVTNEMFAIAMHFDPTKDTPSQFVRTKPIAQARRKGELPEMRVLPRFAKKPEQYLPQRPYAARGGVSTIGVGADGNRGLKGESERYIDAPLGFTFDARKKGDVVWDEIGTASAMLDPASLTLFVDQLQGPFDPFEGRLVHRVAEMFENCAAVPFAALVILAERCKLRRIAIRKSDKVKWNEVARRDPQKTTYGIIRKQYFDFIFSNPPYDDPDQPDYMMIDVPSQKSDSA